MTLAPISLFVYSRPDHAAQALATLRLNPPAAGSELFIFSDGPRDAAAAPLVEATRAAIRNVPGFAKVNVIERERNLGLANSIADGVTQLCERFGRVIVVEDDLRLSPHFLGFMNAALDSYRGNERVMQVSGYMFPVTLPADVESLFLPFTTSWGWATWQRAWRHFDPAMRGYDALKADAAAQHRFNLDGAIDYVSMLDNQRAGRIDSWAIRWYLSVFQRNGLVLYPAHSLVGNFGFDGSGVHSGRNTALQRPPAAERPVSSFPEACEVSPLFRKITASLGAKPTIGGRLRRWLGRAAWG
jgi:hypothetical protein